MLSQLGPTGIWWLAALRQNLKLSSRCLLHQTLWTHATRAGSTTPTTMSNHGSKTPSFRGRPHSQIRIHPEPQRASQSSAQCPTCLQVQPHQTAAAGRFPSLLLPYHLQPSSLPVRTSPSAGASPEGATCLTLAGFKGSCRQAGTAETRGRGSSEQE